MAHDDTVYLRHIRDAISRIGEYLCGVGEKEFYRTHLVQDGVIRQLEIIDEATKKVSVETRRKYVQVPWKDMAGMRDKLIHEYFGVDLELVLLTAANDIPALHEEIEHIIRLLSSKES